MSSAEFTPPSNLARNGSFLGMTVAQFLGAFNDNLFKQVVLLACLDVPANGATNQTIAQILFAAPFVLFSGLAGFLSDRMSKRQIVFLCKLAEVAIVAVGTWTVSRGWLPGSLAILFLMGTHSAFFGPSKYGILSEIVAPHQLPQANGLFLTTTFLGIILGMGAGGALKGYLGTNPWIAGAAFMSVALIGTISASLVHKTAPRLPGLTLRRQDLFIGTDVLALLRRDRLLRSAMLVSMLFWFCGAVVQLLVNEFGKLYLYAHLPDVKSKDQLTSLLAAGLALGIAAGCSAAGFVSKGKVNFRLTIGGACGIVFCLILLWLIGIGPANQRGQEGVVRGLLIGLGISTGFYSLPLQVFIQSRPPQDLKGRVLGVVNLLQWIWIFAAGLFYGVCRWVSEELGWPISATFLATAIVILPVALFYGARMDAVPGPPPGGPTGG